MIDIRTRRNGPGEDALAACVALAGRSWRDAGVAVVALRGYEDLPSLAGGDLDLLVDADEVVKVERLLLEAARASGLDRYLRLERSAGSPTSHYFLDPSTNETMVIDLFTDLNWRGLRFLDEQQVLSDRRAASLIDVPRPAHEVTAGILGKALYGTWVHHSRWRHLAELAEREGDELRHCLTWAFGARQAGPLFDRIRRAELGPDHRLTRRLRRALVWRSLVRRPFRAAKGQLAEIGRVGRRFRRPPGVFVVLLGADGSGKSAVARPLAERLGDHLRGRSWHFHWKPVAVARSSTATAAEPYRREPRGLWLSLPHLARHWLEFVVGGWLWLIPRLAAGGSVIGERYYQDMWLDPRRYRLAVPPKLIRIGANCVLSPDVVLCLLAPVDILRTRKKEVEPEETRAQQDAIRRYAGADAAAFVVDSSRPLDEVVDACETIVFDRLLARDRRRERVVS